MPTSPLNVREYGDPAGQPLLAVHGVTAHAERWQRLATEALPHRRTIAVDLRGHGYSPWTPPWSIEAQVADIVATLDALGLAGPLDVIGHSYGGAIALRLAAAAPECIGRLVLLDPALAADPDDMAQRAAEVLAADGFATVDDATVARNAGLGDDINPAVPIDIAQHLTQGVDGRFRFRFLPLAVAVSFGELCLPIPAIEARPTLLVRALQAPWVTDSVVEHLQSMLGDDLSVENLDCGHMVYWERFDDTARAVADFLG